MIVGAQTLGVALSNRQVEMFLTYLSELTRWNKKINLTGIRQERAIIIKHFLDSLTPLAMFASEEGEKWIDLGAGGGFPGLPLKIARPDLKMTLVESAEKKIAFLHHLVGLLNLEGVAIVQERFERLLSLSPGLEQKFDLLTTRAVAPEVVLEIGARLVRPGGRILFFQVHPEEGLWNSRLKGQSKIAVERVVSLSLPFTQDPRSLILLKVI